MQTVKTCFVVVRRRRCSCSTAEECRVTYSQLHRLSRINICRIHIQEACGILCSYFLEQQSVKRRCIVIAFEILSVQRTVCFLFTMNGNSHPVIIGQYVCLSFGCFCRIFTTIHCSKTKFLDNVVEIFSCQVERSCNLIRLYIIHIGKCCGCTTFNNTCKTCTCFQIISRVTAHCIETCVIQSPFVNGTTKFHCSGFLFV